MRTGAASCHLEQRLPRLLWCSPTGPLNISGRFTVFLHFGAACDMVLSAIWAGL